MLQTYNWTKPTLPTRHTWLMNIRKHSVHHQINGWVEGWVAVRCELKLTSAMASGHRANRQRAMRAREWGKETEGEGSVSFLPSTDARWRACACTGGPCGVGPLPVVGQDISPCPIQNLKPSCQRLKYHSKNVTETQYFPLCNSDSVPFWHKR
jgi:hypothetical protein